MYFHLIKDTLFEVQNHVARYMRIETIGVLSLSNRGSPRDNNDSLYM